MSVLIICIIFIIFNFIINYIYCRIERKIDIKRKNRKVDVKSSISGNEHISIGKRIYRYINSYAYGYVRLNILLVGKIPSHRLRNLLYKYIFGMKISKKTVIYGGCEIRSPWNIEMGDCTIAANCILDGRSGIVIGNNVVLGSGVHIWTEEHDLNDPYFRVLDKNRKPVIIKDYAWVCSDSTLLPGIIINEGCVVASRACVTKMCEEYGIYAGIPAKKIGERNRNLLYKLSGKPTWHFS